MRDPFIGEIAGPTFLVVVFIVLLVLLVQWIIKPRGQSGDESSPSDRPVPSAPPREFPSARPVQTPVAPQPQAASAERVSPPPAPAPVPAPTPTPARTLAPEPVAQQPATYAPRPTPAPASVSPTIHTRTTAGSGVELHDPWKDTDRPWTVDEDTALIRAYRDAVLQGHVQIIFLSRTIGIDQIQVARRLIRVLLNPRGEIDSQAHAPNNRARYSATARQEFVSSFRSGASLAEIAARAGRTQLAVGWQILEHAQPPIPVPESVMHRVRAGQSALSDADFAKQLVDDTSIRVTAKRPVPQAVHSPRAKARPQATAPKAVASVCSTCFQERSVSGVCGCD